MSERTDYRKIENERSLEKQMCFLRHEVESEEMIHLAREGFRKDKVRSATQKVIRNQFTKMNPLGYVNFKQHCAKFNCIFCDCPHQNQDWQKLLEMSYEDRKSQVVIKRCSLFYLKPNRISKKGNSSLKCLIYKRRHYALHFPDLRKKKELNFPSENKTADNDQKSTEALLINLSSEQEIYLKTIMVSLRKRDKEISVRSLSDDRSQRSYIEKNLATELILSSGRDVFSHGPFGVKTSVSEHKIYFLNKDSLN